MPGNPHDVLPMPLTSPPLHVEEEGSSKGKNDRLEEKGKRTIIKARKKVAEEEEEEEEKVLASMRLSILCSLGWSRSNAIDLSTRKMVRLRLLASSSRGSHLITKHYHHRRRGGRGREGQTKGDDDDDKKWLFLWIAAVAIYSVIPSSILVTHTTEQWTSGLSAALSRTLLLANFGGGDRGAVTDSTAAGKPAGPSMIFLSEVIRKSLLYIQHFVSRALKALSPSASIMNLTSAKVGAEAEGRDDEEEGGREEDAEKTRVRLGVGNCIRTYIGSQRNIGEGVRRLCEQVLAGMENI